MAEFNLWLLIVGIAFGAVVTWLVVGTLSRSDDEVAASEQATEAAWIAGLIEEHGGRAPVMLVEQILALHRRYLKGGAGIPMPEPSATLEAPTPPEATTPTGATPETPADETSAPRKARAKTAAS